MIRRATHADRLAVVAMAKRLHEHAGYPLRADMAYFSMALESFIDGAHRLCAVVDDEGPCGVLLAEIQPSIFCGELLAHEFMLWIEPSVRARHFRALIRFYEAWARENGAAAAFLSSLNDGRTAAIFGRLGFEAVQAHHVKVF